MTPKEFLNQLECPIDFDNPKAVGVWDSQLSEAKLCDIISSAIRGAYEAAFYILSETNSASAAMKQLNKLIDKC